MRILIIGSGGREHALAWALANSPQSPEVLIAPGNAGTATIGRNVPVASSDVHGLLELVRREQIDLTVVGPEQPLVAGIVDVFEEAGLRIVGPSAAAAQLEGSKAFSKAFMARHAIPTAAYQTFGSDQYDAAVTYLDDQPVPVVIKASGLAAGKGAIVCETHAAAREALDEMMVQRAFGEAGDEVVIEAFMQGEEASVFVLTDGADYLLLPSAQDHKRVGEGDTGPNTGGMGAYAPAPIVTDTVLEQVRRTIIEPTLDGMREEGMPYRGILYVGLMMTPDGPQVVEFNCRLGDPEAQVLLLLLDADLVEVFDLLARRRLKEATLALRPGAAACVVMASGGYPGAYDKGYSIEGLDTVGAMADVVVFHAGTCRDEAGRVVTNGGRVLGVTAWGSHLPAALDRAYAAVEQITFEGAHYRRDIGQKGIARLRT